MDGDANQVFFYLALGGIREGFNFNFLDCFLSLFSSVCFGAKRERSVTYVRGPYRVIRTSRRPIRRLHLRYGPGITDRKKIICHMNSSNILGSGFGQISTEANRK